MLSLQFVLFIKTSSDYFSPCWLSLWWKLMLQRTHHSLKSWKLMAVESLESVYKTSYYNLTIIVRGEGAKILLLKIFLRLSCPNLYFIFEPVRIFFLCWLSLWWNWCCRRPIIHWSHKSLWLLTDRRVFTRLLIIILQLLSWVRELKYFVQLGFSSDGVGTDKKSSSILIYENKGTEIYTENNGVD